MFLDLSKPTKLPRKTLPTKHQQHPQGLGSNADSDGELKMILLQHHMYKVCSLLKFDKVLSKQAMEFDFSHQSINLRGLDGIQGPFYVGTGCVFNRTALYGFEPPLKPKHKKPALFSSCCGGSKSSNKGSDKKKSSKHVDPTVPIFSLEDIDEGVEGAIHVEWRCSSICNSRDSPQRSYSCYQLRI